MTSVQPATAPAGRPALTLQDIRGASYPEPGADPKKIVRYIQTVFQDGEQDALARYKRATQNLLFADGRQHIDWSLKDKSWREAPADGRIRVALNYIRPILRSRAQRLMSTELMWRVTPRSNEHEERDRAAVAVNLLASRWQQSEMDAKARLALFLADCCGVAYFKQFWNPNIGPLTVATVKAPHPQTGQLTEYPIDAQGQVLADDQGDPLDGFELGFTYRPGDTDTALRTIFNIRTNPDAQSLSVNDGFRWLIDSEVLPISVVKELWGDRAKKVQSTAGVGQMRQYERIVRSIAARSPQSNDLMMNRDGALLPDNQTTILQEYWEAPSPSFKSGRLIVIAGDELLYPLPGEDQEGLPQTIVPFVPIYSERRPLDSYGRPVVDDLIAPQKIINRQWGGILEEQGFSGAGQWAMFDIPGLSDQITNLNGAHIKIPVQSALANRPIGELIQRIQPAHASTDRWRMVQEAKATMFDIGAFHEIQRGQVPPGVDSGVAVQLLQEAENGQMHDAVRTLKRSFIDWARQTGKLAKWGYGEDEERWIPQQRSDLDFMVQSVKGIDLPDFDAIDVDLEGFRPQSQASYNAEIKEAMAQQWIDPKVGLQLMDLGRGIKGIFESENRHYIRARRQNLAIEKGQYRLIPPPAGSPQAELGLPFALLNIDGSPFVLPQDDAHLEMINIHQEIFLDDTKPWPVRQVVGLLINERRAFLQRQLAATMVERGPAPATNQAQPASNGAKSNG